ncbi:MAG TPA: Hpt domain-containing protein [Rhizomicrobium sp.]|nr:Hpt domain-containing protein [Rhizomicrobium sp.]
MTADRDILAGLRPNYLVRLDARISRLRAFAEVLGRGPLQPQEHDELNRAAHSMASSAAVFGYAGLSAAARAAEETFEQPTIDPAWQRASLLRLLAEAERVLASGP